MSFPRCISRHAVLLSFPAALLCFFATVPAASAATYYWVGGSGASMNVARSWNTTDPTACGTGNSSLVPSSADTIIFDKDCDTTASQTGALTVSVFKVQNAFTGSIVIRAAFTATTTTLSGGTLILNGGQTFTNAGALTLTGSNVFSAGTGTLTLTSGAATINVNSSVTLYNLTVNATASATKTIAPNDQLIVNGTLTLTDGLLSQATIPSPGTVSAKGNIIQASTFDGGTARVVINGTSSQLFSGTATSAAGLLPLIFINKTAGTLTLSGSIRTGNNWIYTAGTIDATTNNATNYFSVGLTIAGSHTLNNVVFNAASLGAYYFTVSTGTTLTVNGSLTLTSGLINYGTVDAKGAVSVTNAFKGGNGDLYLTGNATRTITLGSGAYVPGLTLSGANTTIVAAGSGIVDIGGDLTQSAGTFTGGAGSVNVRGNFCQTGGTFTAPSGTLIVGSFCHEGGTFDANSGTVSINSAADSTTIGATTFNNLSLNNGGLIGHWRFDEITGSVAYDAIPHGHSGSLVADASFSTSHPTTQFTNAGSILFDGTGDSVSIPQTPSLNILNHGDMALSFWINPQTVSAGDLIVKGSGQPQFGLQTGGFYFCRNGTFCWFSESIGGTSAAGTYPATGTWTHVVMVKDGETAYLYLNGAYVLRDTGFPYSISGFSPSNASAMTLGGSNALLDDVRIYNRALTTDDISALYDGVDAPTFTLDGDMTVGGTLSLNNVTLDVSSDRHALTYGVLVNTGGTIELHTPAASSSSSSTSSVRETSGGGGRRGSPGRDGIVAASQNSSSSSSTTSSPLTNSSGTSSIPVETLPGFKDVPLVSWFANAVNELSHKGILSGYTDAAGHPLEQFGPADPVTIGQILKIALLSSGHDLPSSLPLPKNPSATDWSAPYIAFAESLGIDLASQVSQRNATRGEVIHTLLQTFDVELSTADNPFSDLPPSHPYEKDILTAVQLGLVKGDDNAMTVRPDDQINRAEVAVLVMRFLQL